MLKHTQAFAVPVTHLCSCACALERRLGVVSCAGRAEAHRCLCLCAQALQDSQASLTTACLCQGIQILTRQDRNRNSCRTSEAAEYGANLATIELRAQGLFELWQGDQSPAGQLAKALCRL